MSALSMDDETKRDKELADIVSDLKERLTTLETKVTKLSTAQEQGKTRMKEIQEFSENIITLQEKKLQEIEENAKEQKKLVAELRVQLQSLQNSRVNHKDVLIRHENQSKKLIELVNDISERQHEFEIERTNEDVKARRFSSFEAKGRRTKDEELYSDEVRRARQRYQRRIQSAAGMEGKGEQGGTRRKSTSPRRLQDL